MQPKADVQSRRALFSGAGWKSVGALPVAVIFILMAILYARASATVFEFEAPILLAFLNTIFLCVIPLIVAHMAARSYRATGIIAFLMVGCGLIFFGISSLYAGWVMPLAGGPNPTVTLHNLGSLFAGFYQFVGAHFFLQVLTGAPETKPRVQRYWLFYAGIFVLISITAVFAFRGNLPVFFDPLTGASPLRQLVLGAAICLFAVAGLAFVEIYVATKTDFAYWYALALFLIAIGLICVMIQPSVGSLLGWIGGGAQYLGCAYFLCAFLQGQRERSAPDSASTSKTNWMLWPYLEQKVKERTNALVQINEALKTAEANYRNIFENAPVGFFQSSSSGRYLNVNPMMAKIYGFESPAEMIDGITDIATQIYVEPAGREEFRRLIAEQEHIFEFVQKNRRRDGSIIWTTTDARVVKDAKGDILYYEGFLRDYTEIKEAEQAVRESREFVQATLDSLSAHICVLSEDGTILAANKAWFDFAAANSQAPENVGVGANYLAVCDTATGPGSEIAHEFAAGVRAVASGALEIFKQDYSCHSPNEQRWFVAHVRRFASDASRRVVIAHENITERKLAEDALRRSEAKFRAVVENSNDGILFGDANAVISYSSPSYERINGFSDDERLGHSGFETVHPDDQQMLRKYWAQVIENPDKATKAEYRIRHKDGSWHWVESTAQNLLENPDIQHVVVSSRDITERKQFEDALRESEEKYRKLFSEMASGCSVQEIICDNLGQPVDYFTLDVNAAFEKLLGVSREDVIGGKASEILPPEELKHWLGIFGPVALTGSSVHYEMYSPINNKHFEGVAYSLGNRQFAVVFSDDTARKQAEDALRKREQEFVTLVENSPDMVVRFDTSFRHLYCNSAVERQLGRSLLAILGKTPLETGGPREQGEFVIQSLGQVLETGQEQEVEQRCPTPWGMKYFQTRIVPERNAQGSIESLLAITRDVTAHRVAENALAEKTQELEGYFTFSLDLLCVADLEGYFRRLNPEWERTLGYPLADLMGKHFLDFVHPDDLDATLDVLSMLGNHKRVNNFENRYRCQDGSYRCIEWRSVPIGNLIYTVARDITERKRMQDELQKANANLARAQEIAHIGSWEDYLPTAELHWSDEMYRIMGFQPGNSVNLVDAIKCFPPDELVRFQNAVNAAIEQDVPYSMDYRIIRPDGEERFIHDEGVIIRDDSGQAIWMFGATQDITEHKLAEAGLLSRTREAETLRQAAASLTSSLDLNQVLDNILSQLAQVVPYDSATVFLVDEGHLRVVGGRGLPRLQEILGQVFPADNKLFLETQRTGRPLILADAQQDPRFDKWGGADYIHGWMGIPLIVAGEVIGRLTIDSRTANAYRERHAELALAFANQAAIALQNVRLYEQVRQELDERKRAEDALRTSEERYRRIVDTAYEGIWVVDDAYRTTFVNARMEEMLGYSSAELLGKRVDAFLYETSSADIQQINQHLHRIGGQQERRFKRNDGAELWALVSAKPILDDRNVFKGSFAMFSDITERKQTEAALRESQALVSSVMNSTSDMIWLVDPENFGLLIYNNGLRDYFLQGLGLHIQPGMRPEHLHPTEEFAQLWQEFYRRALKDGSYVTEYATYAGSTILLLTFNIVKRDGIVFGISVFGKDITERKHAEAALQKFAFMANTAPEFMSLINRQGMYESVNDAYCRARGKSREELIGHSLAEVWGESLYRERLAPNFERCFAGQIVRYEETFIFSGKEMRNYQVGLYPYAEAPGGQVTHVVVVTFDITEYKQIEAALRKSEQNLNKAQHFARLGSWTWNIQTNHLDWSDEMYNIFDVDKATFTGSLPDVIAQAIHPDDRAKVEASNSSVVNEGKPIPVDYRIIRRDGSVRVVFGEAGELVRDEAGQPFMLSGTVQDITERKQLEEDLRASLAEKEALLKEVHHRVKNNLQIISSLLSMQASSSQNEQVIHALGESTNRVRAMALIHEKLYQSKNLEYIQAGEYISELMDQLVSSFSGQMRNISLDVQIADLTLDINKAIPCGMIVNELVSNALKYAFPAPRGGLIRVCLDMQDGKVRLVISDNGVGLPANVDVQHPETLGLELVSILSHQLKASLEVTRQVGTTFTIIFNA